MSCNNYFLQTWHILYGITLNLLLNEQHLIKTNYFTVYTQVAKISKGNKENILEPTHYIFLDCFSFVRNYTILVLFHGNCVSWNCFFFCAFVYLLEMMKASSSQTINWGK